MNHRRLLCQTLGGIALLGTDFWAARAVDAAEPTVIRHDFFESPDSDQLNYKGEVLTLLLEKSKSKFGPYILKRGTTIGWTQSRAYLELERGNLDVMASMTSKRREQDSMPIRYCLYRGLLGVRIGLGRPEVVQTLNQIQTWEELKTIGMGQVFDWPDYTILTESGLQVMRLPDKVSSYRRLKIGTFKLLPMGVVEVEPIAKQHELAMISKWALAYPTAYYFFVGKKNQALADRLNFGFEAAIKDQSFDQLFAKRIGPLVMSAQLDSRKIFHLKNSLLPKETPLNRPELWHPVMLALLQGSPDKLTRP